MTTGLAAGFLLDRQWHWLRGEMEQTKRPALLALARVLGDVKIPYAIIGGVALQVHQSNPRTTLDIDVAVIQRSTIPREALTRVRLPFPRSVRALRKLVFVRRDAHPVQRRSHAGHRHRQCR